MCSRFLYELERENKTYDENELKLPDRLASLVHVRCHRIADVAISKRPLLFTVWTQLRLRSHQNFYKIFTRKHFLPTSAGNAQAQMHFCR